MVAKIYTTCKEENKLLNFNGEFLLEYRNTDVVETFERPQDTATYCVTLHPDITRHTFYGFGGAFKNPDGTLAVVLLNRSDTLQKARLRIGH